MEKKKFVCRNCGKIVSAGDCFCGGCGIRLTEETVYCEGYEDKARPKSEDAESQSYAYEEEDASKYEDEWESNQYSEGPMEDGRDEYGTDILSRLKWFFGEIVYWLRRIINVIADNMTAWGEDIRKPNPKYEDYDRIIAKGKNDINSLTTAELHVYMNQKGYSGLVTICTILNILTLVLQIPGAALLSWLFGNTGTGLVVFSNILLIAEFVVAALGRNRANAMRIIYGLSIFACVLCINIIGLIVNIVIFVSFGKYTETSL
ncbi:MAG: hypothetical protein LIP10_15865 [Clostridiales bacterium]|nr:hypothetical protein [Clostridiales bacterium]